MYESILRLGSDCAFAVGGFYLLIGITHFLLPRSQLRGAEGVNAAFFFSLAERSCAFKLHYWVVVLAGLTTIPLLAALLALLRGSIGGISLWFGAMGGLGAGLLVVDFAYVGVQGPRLAKAFARASEGTREAILALGLPHVDPCFLGWGLLGGGLAGLNGELLRSALVPRAFAGLGIIGGALLVATFVGALLRRPRLIDVAAGLGGFLVGPAWAIWAGFVFRA